MPRTEPFERYGDEYEAWFDEHDDMYQAELEAIRRLLPTDMTASVEVGVGSGRFAVPLGIRTGVEPCVAMADKARALGVDVREGVAEELPFPDETLDVALLVTTICFVDDIHLSFAEAFRVLRPGGCLLVAFVDRNSDLGKRYEAEKAQSKFYRHATFYSADEVVQYLCRVGFELAETAQTLIPGEPVGSVRTGLGDGAFVVIKAMRPL